MFQPLAESPDSPLQEPNQRHSAFSCLPWRCRHRNWVRNTSFRHTKGISHGGVGLHFGHILDTTNTTKDWDFVVWFRWMQTSIDSLILLGIPLPQSSRRRSEGIGSWGLGRPLPSAWKMLGWWDGCVRCWGCNQGWAEGRYRKIQEDTGSMEKWWIDVDRN